MNRVLVAMRDEVISVTEDLQVVHTLGDDDRIECMAVNPATPSRVFLGTADNGLLRSEDHGGNFERVGDDSIEESRITSIAFDPTHSNRVVIGTEPSALYLSTDEGMSWRHVGRIADVSSASEWSFPPRPHTHHVRWISIAPADPDRWYVGIEAGAFLVTADGGESWMDRPPGSRRDTHWIATHPDDARRVYVAAGDGYAESNDSGASWIHPQEGLDHRYVWSVAVDATDPDIRYISAARGPRQAHSANSASSYVYRRAGEDPWEPVEGLPQGDGALRPVLATGDTSGTIYAASYHGVFWTEHDGKRWEPYSKSWKDEYKTQTPRSIAIIPE